MKQETVLTENKYARLVNDLQKLIEQGRAKAQTAVTPELMATYWTVGQRIARLRLTKIRVFSVSCG